MGGGSRVKEVNGREGRFARRKFLFFRRRDTLENAGRTNIFSGGRRRAEVCQ